MTKQDEVPAAEQKVLDAVGKWHESQWMRLRVTHVELVNTVHPVELDLFDAYVELQARRKCPRRAGEKGDDS